jgi:hypothetical protein
VFVTQDRAPSDSPGWHRSPLIRPAPFDDERLAYKSDDHVGVGGVSECGVTCSGSVRTSPAEHRELGDTLTSWV